MHTTLEYLLILEGEAAGRNGMCEPEQKSAIQPLDTLNSFFKTKRLLVSSGNSVSHIIGSHFGTNLFTILLEAKPKAFVSESSRLMYFRCS